MRIVFVITAFCAFLFSACAPLPPPLTIISNQADKAQEHYVPIGSSVKKRDCLNAGPLFLIWWGADRFGKEYALVSNVLEENNADALMEARIIYSYISIPYIYMRTCITVSGIPAKLKGESQ